MREYINGWWSGLSQRGRAIISVVVAVCLLVAFYLMLTNAGAFSQVSESLDKLLLP
jgi:type II secretory pathway component PulM